MKKLFTISMIAMAITASANQAQAGFHNLTYQQKLVVYKLEQKARAAETKSAPVSPCAIPEAFFQITTSPIALQSLLECQRDVAADAKAKLLAAKKPLTPAQKEALEKAKAEKAAAAVVRAAARAAAKDARNAAALAAKQLKLDAAAAAKQLKIDAAKQAKIDSGMPDFDNTDEDDLDEQL